MKDYLFDAQKRFYGCSARRRLFLGGRQSGKTTTVSVEAIEEAGHYGRDVYFVGPKQRMVYAAADRVRDLVQQFDHSGKLKSNVTKSTRDEIRFSSGGRIRFSTLRGSDWLRGEDVIVLDEANFLADEAWTEIENFMRGPQKAKWLATMTPRRGLNTLDRLRDYGFKAIPVTTQSNPLITPDSMEAVRNEYSDDEFRRAFMVGMAVNDHLIVEHETDSERVHECVLCELEVRIPLSSEAERMAMTEGWTYGMAQDHSCTA